MSNSFSQGIPGESGTVIEGQTNRLNLILTNNTYQVFCRANLFPLSPPASGFATLPFPKMHVFTGRQEHLIAVYLLCHFLMLGLILNLCQVKFSAVWMQMQLSYYGFHVYGWIIQLGHYKATVGSINTGSLISDVISIWRVCTLLKEYKTYELVQQVAVHHFRISIQFSMKHKLSFAKTFVPDNPLVTEGKTNVKG